MKLNTLQINTNGFELDTSIYMLNVLNVNENQAKIEAEYKKVFARSKVKNISFSTDGMFCLILSLKGKIAVSLGESESIVEGAKKAKEFGADIEFIGLKKDGSLDIDSIDDSFDYIFVSSYIMDTYVKTDLKKIKEKSAAILISNASVKMAKISDIYVLDSYKLCGLGGMGVLVYDEGFDDIEISQLNLQCLDLSIKSFLVKKKDTSLKSKFLEQFKKVFGDDLFFFVDPKDTLDHTLHLGLKGIKMRELIRTMAFEDIYITNGEGCSLGLSRPSRIIQEMGYSEDEARWGLSLDFSEELSTESIEKLVDTIFKKYRQIKVLG